MASLIKTTLLSSISTSLKTLLSLVTTKIIAIYLGPAGIAVLGNFNNFLSIILNFSTCGINNGIVKYIAEFHANEQKRKEIVKTSVFIVLLCTFFSSLYVVAFAGDLAVTLLRDPEYTNIFYLLGVSLIFFSLSSVFLSILNGLKEISKYFFINIISSILSTVFSIFLIYYWNLSGALLAIIITQSLTFLLCIILIKKENSFSFSDFYPTFNKESTINLSHYSLMSIVASLTLPLAYIFLRTYITNTISLDAAGYWQGIVGISGAYLAMVTTSLSVYYLPRLSEIDNQRELKKEILSGYKILLPIVAILSLGLYFFREFIILTFYSEQFLPMMDLFTFQLIGDFIKICAWLLSYILIAKAMTRIFIVGEVVFTGSFILLSILFLNAYGLIGITYAYALNYCFYLIFLILIFRSLLFREQKISG